MNQRIGYRNAVARQPEALETGRIAIEAALAQMDLGAFAGKSVGFAGIGASFQAAMIGAFYLRDRGVSAYAYCPTDLYGAVDTAAESFVALSASGQSREISEVMALRPALPRIAICRAAENPLAELTGLVLPTHSGADNGASSTGYTGMLLAIGMLADRLAGQDSAAVWSALPGAIDSMLSTLTGPAKAAADLLANRHSTDIVGAKTAFATAGEAAMLIREAVRVPAAGWDTLNYLHGPMESQDSTTGVIALGDEREVKIAVDMAGFGCPSVLITSRRDIAATDNLVVMTIPELGNDIARAILQIVAVQMITGDLQDTAGLTNMTFRYRQTDTKLKPWSATEI